MEGDALTVLVMLGAGWMFALMLGTQVGVRVERWRRKQEVDAFELPDTDARHWKKLYEELAEEYDALTAHKETGIYDPYQFMKERDERREAAE